jgi:hypothetical protein
MIIELDTVADGHYGPTAERAAIVITDGYNVGWEIVTEHGPGGGHPVIRYEGTADELRRMVAEHYGPDTVDDYFVLSPEARWEREAQVRYLIQTTGAYGVYGGALDALVRAIVDAWETDVASVRSTLIEVTKQRKTDAAAAKVKWADAAQST